MAKFYVQSGDVKMVLQARDGRSAAIWAAHRKLNDALPFLEGEESSDTVFQTLDIVSEWSRLLVALDRLNSRISAFTIIRT
jgi:hypothetical protein